MKFNIETKRIYKYANLILSLICAFWLISLFELYMSISNGDKVPNLISAFIIKFNNDYWTGLVIGLLFLPLFISSNFFFKKGISIIIKLSFLLIVTLQFSLVKYSLTTFINLGADILGYSFDDAFSTVTVSETISILYFLPFLIFPLMFFLLYLLFNKYLNNRIVIGTSILSILLFGSIALINHESTNSKYQNKLAFLTKDVIKFQKEKKELNASNVLSRKDYPLLKPFSESKDVLSPFIEIKEQKPNIVFIIVEGLGSEFVNNNYFSGFTPYLDSLIDKSLYWENFVSTTGRSFGILPSIFGSLPYGEKGFLELTNTPSHITLISVLKANGYLTSYYSGSQSTFDRKINFLEYNGIDELIDENKYGTGYTKTASNAGGFSWGYPDSEIFRKTLSSLESKKEPRLDIVMTVSMHEPFDYPEKNKYMKKVTTMINSSKFLPKKKEIENHKDIFGSLLYADKSIKHFIKSYEKRPEFENTIFIITGDHRLIPIPQKDKLCRFHVPFLIYSPMLKKPVKFKSISSHWDVTPSLLSYLMNNYKFNKLDKTAWMSQGLDTAKYFRNIHKIPLMRYKGSINDFIYKDYFYADGELYKINEKFGTYKIKDDAILLEIADSLMAFKKINSYITKKNRIFPDSLNIYIKPKIEFTNEQLATINKLIKGKNFDESLFVAKELAYNKKYNNARLLCDFILNEYPNYTDVRILKGRTLAWEQKYTEAEVELINALQRSPYYDDAYLALLDLYWWSNKDEKSLEIEKKSKINEIQNPEVSFKMAQAYQRMNNLAKATKIIDSILMLDPENSTYSNFKNSVEQNNERNE